LAQEKSSVIAPGNGSEQRAQNGALMRGALQLQGPQRCSDASTGAEQTEQSAG